jgi:hypothetical protein
MRQRDIPKQVREVNEKLKRLAELAVPLQRERDRLQAACKHQKHVKVAHANTGNYDPSADYYWYRIECLSCGKRWEEEQTAFNERMRNQK